MPRYGRNSVAREMSFRATLILWIVVELLWFGLQLSFVSVVYSPNRIGRHLVKMADGTAGRGEQFHPAVVSGLFF